MTTRFEIDMSPAAITQRLEEMRRLYKLMVYLKAFKPAGAGEQITDPRMPDSDR